MKIGELFIALGFDVKGRERLDEINTTVVDVAGSAAKAALGINVLNLALLALLDTAGKAGMALQSFFRETGAATDELQRWEHRAVVGGVAADKLRGAIESLSQARAAFALGEPQAVGAWSILGVSPLQDPFVVITQLRERISKIPDAAIARALLAKVGLESLTPILRAQRHEFEAWSRDFIVTPDQVKRLADLNAAWESLKLSTRGVMNVFASAIAPAFTWLSRALEKVARLAASFSQWLEKGGIIATATRWAIVGLSIASLALGAALAVVTAAAGALLATLSLLSLGIAPVVLAFAPLALVIGVIAGAVVGLALLLDDFWTAAEGGQSFFNWNKGLLLTVDNVNRLAASFERLIDLWDKVNALTTPKNIRTGEPLSFSVDDKYVQDRLAALAAPSGGTRAANVTNNTSVEVKVDGARSPEATAAAVSSSLKRELSGAARQVPASNY